MKRCFLATVVVSLFVGLAPADYVVIKIDLNKIKGGGGGGPGPGGPGPGGPGPGVQGGGGVGVPGGGLPGQPAGPMPSFSGPLPQFVYAYLEVKTPLVPRKDNRYGTYMLLAHELSPHIIVPYDPDVVGGFVIDAPVAKRFEDMVKKESKDKQQKTPEKILSWAGYALQRGLMAEFHKMMGELGAADGKDIKAAVNAYAKTKEALGKAPKADDPNSRGLVEELKKDGYRQVSSAGGHYTLLTNVSTGQKQNAELEKRLARLEYFYSTFFYWFALKGQLRAQPPYRLVVVVIDTASDKSKEFLDRREAFNNLPMVASGFTARRDNVIIMGASRVDSLYTSLKEFNDQLASSFKLDLTTVLMAPSTVDTKKDPKLMQLLPYLQMLALCQRAMEEDSELVTLSHEGIRQLSAATNLLPRNVATAEWARFGLASFFEMPSQAFYPSTGGPNWQHLINWKILSMVKKKDDTNKTDPPKTILDARDAREVLLNVITDQYFRQAYESEAQWLKEKGNAMLKLKAQDELEMARCTAWSLMYYLMRGQPAELEAYFQELAKLPRDLDYDGKVLRECFYRAFKLLMQDPNNKERNIPNVGGLDSLATKWFVSMSMADMSLDTPQLQAEVLRHRVEEYVLRRRAAGIEDMPAGFGAGFGAGNPPAVGPGAGPGGKGKGPGN